jgi:hypothetical protein
MGNEDHGGGAAEQYFTREFVVASTRSRWSSTTPRTLDHYFMTAGTDEIAIDPIAAARRLEAHRAGVPRLARKRPTRPQAPAPVCRFYARAPNSHFYTGPSAPQSATS